MVVKYFFEFLDLLEKDVRFAKKVRNGLFSQRDSDSARNDKVEEIACSKVLPVHPHHIFLESAELGQGEGQTGIVSQSSEISQVICNSFPLVEE
jgi:hypothetical protein